PSNNMSRKELIKLEATFLTPEQANQLGYYAPKATIKIIEDYEVVRKLPIKLAKRIEGVIVCTKGNCISHKEAVESSFNVKSNAQENVLICKYC
ncbi:aspartate carbamoyltransferase regulatory subunit, partial [Morganella morganii]|uniref:aspartate carbamoyltransferase regulatory subunit n=1 Tax=Morganella morganii TaxID=582 RepID=UPI0024B85247